VPYGNDLSAHITNLIKEIFVLVEDNGDFDAIISAEIVSFDHQPKLWAGQEGKISISNKLTLRDKSGGIVWVETITGIGLMEIGTLFTEKKRIRERILLAIDDVVYKSANEISSSKEIKGFSEKIK
jgi:hypothetical protein